MTFEIRPARDDDRMPIAIAFAALAEERDGIATEPPVDVEARAASWVLDGTIVAVAAAEIIGSLHVFFPMMVLPLASALGKIDPNLEDAARMLGAPWWKVFLRVTLPLSMPGFVAGFTLVFSLTAGSFVIPAILGGASAIMLGNLIEQQIFVVYDWPFGAAIAVVLVGLVLAVNGVSMWLLEGRRLTRAD